MPDWLYVLHPPRVTFIQDATEAEQAVMSEHFAYLEGLLRDGTLILAGPSLDPPFGIVAFEAESEQEARRIMEGDPSVRAGVQRGELHPFRVSLLRGRDVV